MFKKIILGFAVLLAVAQFVRPARNVSAMVSPNDINVRYPVPAAVQPLLQRSCYDCHSNNTRYPWYAEVQPVRWWLDRHINDAKRHLNFSEYSAYPVKRAAKKAEEIASELKEHEMPLPSYLWLHAEARLTDADIALLTAWSQQLHAQVVSK